MESMTYILIPISIFWVIVVIKNILFWAYFWQLKQYRYDRVKAHFELPSSQNILINKRLSFIFFLFVVGSIGIIIGNEVIILLCILAAFAYYTVFAFHTVRQFRSRILVLPIFTQRIIFIVGVSVAAHLLVMAILFMWLDHYWLLQGKLLLDFFSIFICYIGVFISNFPVEAQEKRMYKKAQDKRMSFEGLLTIGVTGSYGKTSVKEFLATILSEQFSVLRTEANNNSYIGISKAILDDLNETHDIFIAEMGAYTMGDIAKTASIARPSIGVLTGLGPQHLSLFGGMQNTQKAKYELIEALPQKGLAVFNGDNDAVRSLFRKCNKPKRLYTTDRLLDFNGSGIQAESVRYTPEGMEITIHDEDKKTQVITTSLLGKHNATNLLGAITVARALGMSFSAIRKGVKKITPLPHTLQPMRGIKGSVVVDDSYSGNLHGVFAALEVLSRMRGENKILVFQPLIELGEAAKKAHRDIGVKIGEVCDYCIVVSQDYYALMYQEAVRNGMQKDAMMCITDIDEAFEKLDSLIGKKDIVLVENRVSQNLFDKLVFSASTTKPKPKAKPKPKDKDTKQKNSNKTPSPRPAQKAEPKKSKKNKK